jgi:hypothetical protein
MSLLMDALKRAEAAKQETGRAPYSLPGTATDDGLSLEPIPGEASRTSTNPLPDLAAHLDAVDADLAAVSLPEAQPAAAPARSAPPSKPVVEPRDAVRNSFAAKPAVPPPSRLPLWLALGTLGVAGIAIGGYVWYQMNTMNRSTLAVVSRPAAPAASQPVSQPAPPPAPQSDFGQNLPPTVAFAPPPADTPLFAPRRFHFAALQRGMAADEVGVKFRAGAHELDRLAGLDFVVGWLRRRSAVAARREKRRIGRRRGKCYGRRQILAKI